LKFRHGTIVENIFTHLYLYAKFNYDRLRNEKVVGLENLITTTSPGKRRRRRRRTTTTTTTFVVIGDPLPGPKLTRFRDLSRDKTALAAGWAIDSYIGKAFPI